MMRNLKTKYYNWKENRRYKKFKGCSLPYPFWDKRRDTFEWVYYDEVRQCGYDVENSLYEALGNVSCSGVTYHYEAYMYGRKNPKQKECKYQNLISHCHSFDEIVRCLYEYPETFRIPDEFKDEYSNQELRYLNKVQSYLKIIGLKDGKKSKEIQELNDRWQEIDDKKRKSINDLFFLLNYSRLFERQREKEDLERYSNELAVLYSSYYPLYTDKKGIAEAYINGKKDYIIKVKYSFDNETKVGRKYLVVNEDNRYVGSLEVISEEYISFKDLKEDMVDYKLAGYRSFKDYKQHLFYDYKEIGNIYQEEFKDDSLLIYLKVKVLEKF